MGFDSLIEAQYLDVLERDGMEIVKEKIKKEQDEKDWENYSCFAECVNCKTEHRKVEEMEELEFKGSNEWICFDCLDDLKLKTG